VDVYTYLEPLYNDNRRIRMRTIEGHCVLTHIDEVIDDMLRKDYLFDVAMPHIPARWGRPPWSQACTAAPCCAGCRDAELLALPCTWHARGDATLKPVHVQASCTMVLMLPPRRRAAAGTSWSAPARWSPA
jgi:hypothetical protein